jgi:peptide/nickel transport system substrate-binding protein/microcin C transport system substrate-binding protein
LPPRVFGPAFVAPRTDTAPDALRRNMLKARELLEQAGWKLDAEGKLRNAQGQLFEFEYMSPRDGGVTDWIQRLAKLGITMKERVVDFALYQRRLEAYDFDMVTIAGGDFTLPNATEFLAAMGSKSADEPGNNNLRGIKSKAVDRIIDVMSKVTTYDELRDAARALDRVVLWSFWQVPDLYGDTENASYWSFLGLPAVRPKYYTIDTDSSEFGPWPIRAWWDKRIEGQPATTAQKTASR